MYASFIKNSLIYGLGQAGAALLTLASIPILTHHLSPEAFGVLDLLNLFLILLTFTVALEISQSIARFMADCDSHDERASYTSTALFFSLGTYVLASVLIWLGAPFISEMLFSRPDEVIYVYWVIPWFVLHGVASLFTNQLRWENRPRAYILLQNLKAALFIILLLLGFHIFSDPLKGALFAYLVSLAIICCVGLGLLLRSKSLRWTFNASRLRSMLLFSAPLVPSSIAVFALNYIDRIMVSQFLTLSDVGIYGLAFKLSTMLLLFSGIFQTAIVPLIYEHYRKAETPSEIAKSLQLFLFLLISAMVGLTLFLPELFFFLIDPQYLDSVAIIPVLCASVLMSSVYIFAPGLVIAKKTGMVAGINVVGMVINIALNYWGLKLFGLIGVAYATLATQSLMAVAHFIFSQKHYPIGFAWKRIALAALLAIFGLVVAGALSQMGAPTMAMFAVKALGVMCFMGLLLALLIPRSDIKALVQRVRPAQS